MTTTQLKTTDFFNYVVDNNFQSKIGNIILAGGTANERQPLANNYATGKLLTLTITSSSELKNTFTSIDFSNYTSVIINEIQNASLELLSLIYNKMELTNLTWIFTTPITKLEESLSLRAALFTL